VNDLGGSFKGEGKGTKAADIIVEGMSLILSLYITLRKSSADVDCA
jgi:hypothetical protein